MRTKLIDTVEEWRCKAFSAILKRKIKENGIDQQVLAYETGLSKHTISNYVVGNTLPNPVIIARLAEALHCPISSLSYYEFDEFTAVGFDEEQAEVLRKICKVYGGLSPNIVIDAANSLYCPDKKYTALEALIFEAQKVVKESEE